MQQQEDADRRQHSPRLEAEAGSYAYTGHAPTLVAQGENYIERNAPDVRVRSEVDAAGSQKIGVDGKPSLGTSGEPRVLQLLREAINKEGGPRVIDARVGSEVDNRNGIDGFLYFEAAAPIRMQYVRVVTLPADNTWRELSKGRHTRLSVPTDKASAAIEAAIRKKVANQGDSVRRGQLLLALDDPVGMYAHRNVLAAFEERCPSVAVYGFRAVWIVGQSVELCRRLL